MSNDYCVKRVTSENPSNNLKSQTGKKQPTSRKINLGAAAEGIDVGSLSSPFDTCCSAIEPLNVLKKRGENGIVIIEFFFTFQQTRRTFPNHDPAEILFVSSAGGWFAPPPWRRPKKDLGQVNQASQVLPA